MNDKNNNEEGVSLNMPDNNKGGGGDNLGITVGNHEKNDDTAESTAEAKTPRTTEGDNENKERQPQKETETDSQRSDSQTSDSQTSEKQTLYSSDDPSNKQADLEKAGFDLDIPQKEKAAEKSLGKEDDNVVDSIVKQATVSDEAEDKILEELETMDPDIDMDVPVAPSDGKTAKIAKIIFFVILGIAIIVVSYFYAAKKGIAFLNIEPAQTISESEEKLLDIKSKKISGHFAVANLKLRELGYSLAKLSANPELKTVKKNIEETLATIKTEIKKARKDFEEDPDAEARTLVYLKEAQEEAKTAEDVGRTQNIERMLKLMRDKELLDEIASINMEGLNGDEALTVLRPLTDKIKSDPYGLASYVQNSRVDWNEIIREIESTTQTVDPDFSFNGYKNKDGISYSSFSFSADNETIIVTGEIQTEDEKTFTRIADLKDAFERSPKFNGVSGRSYRKNESEAGFSSSINIQFNLND